MEKYYGIYFKDYAHKELFVEVLDRMGIIKYGDVYREALAYLITLNVVCRQHIDSIYRFDDECINSKCVNASWQTSSSLRTTLLAFNLFNGYFDLCPENLRCYITPDNIFCCDYAPYYASCSGLLKTITYCTKLIFGAINNSFQQ